MHVRLTTQRQRKGMGVWNGAKHGSSLLANWASIPRQIVTSLPRSGSVRFGATDAL